MSRGRKDDMRGPSTPHLVGGRSGRSPYIEPGYKECHSRGEEIGKGGKSKPSWEDFLRSSTSSGISEPRIALSSMSERERREKRAERFGIHSSSSSSSRTRDRSRSRDRDISSSSRARFPSPDLREVIAPHFISNHLHRTESPTPLAT